MNDYCSWSRKNHAFLQSRSSPLEFYLHRSQYMHLLLVTYPGNPRPAIAYANEMLRPFYAHHDTEFLRLMACLAYLPISRLRTSPYAELASHSLHTDLEPLFAKEYCASLGMSKQVPLRVVGDIGGGGALVKIEKGRKIMRERKSEWSQTDELPVSNSCLLLPFAVLIWVPDRNTISTRTSLSFHIHLSSVEGAVNRPESPHDACMWPCYFSRQFAEITQAGQVY